jgi:hypothetical protein
MGKTKTFDDFLTGAHKKAVQLFGLITLLKTQKGQD